MESIPNELLVFAENQRIETPRLILRPITLADAEDMFEYAGDPETTRFVFPTHRSLQETKNGIAAYFMAAPLGKYGIEEKRSGKLIGAIDLRVKPNECTGEIGYVLNKDYWGQGYMPEAASALLELGFEKMGLIRIFGLHDVRNHQSGRVMEKIGLRQEAVLTAAKISKGAIIDEALHGLSRKEWLQSKKKR